MTASLDRLVFARSAQPRHRQNVPSFPRFIVSIYTHTYTSRLPLNGEKVFYSLGIRMYRPPISNMILSVLLHTYHQDVSSIHLVLNIMVLFCTLWSVHARNFLPLVNFIDVRIAGGSLNSTRPFKLRVSLGYHVTCTVLLICGIEICPAARSQRRSHAGRICEDWPPPVIWTPGHSGPRAAGKIVSTYWTNSAADRSPTAKFLPCAPENKAGGGIVIPSGNLTRLEKFCFLSRIDLLESPEANYWWGLFVTIIRDLYKQAS